MTHDKASHLVPAKFMAQANLSPEKYADLYARSIADPEVIDDLIANRMNK